MKIIRKGDPNKLVGYKVICKECNCIYEIDLSETHPYNVMGNFVEREWRCPTCYAYQSTWQGGRNTCDPLYREEKEKQDE